jgi:hypothetical protein
MPFSIGMPLVSPKGGSQARTFAFRRSQLNIPQRSDPLALASTLLPLETWIRIRIC